MGFIPGIGCHIGAMILADVSDFNRFESPDKLLAYAGMSPSTYQLGQFKNCYHYIEKRGSRFLRYVFFNATKHVCLYYPTFPLRLNSTKKRAEAKHYSVAIATAAKKLVCLIYAMAPSRQRYHSVF